MKMKTFLLQIKSYLTPVLMVVIFTAGNAQTIHRAFKFKKGDEFQRQIVIKSNCLLQRGDQKLNISTYSAVTKSYKVNDVVNSNATINITVNKIVDSINALGQKVSYNSENRPDPDSYIQMALLQLVGKPEVVSVDENGSIAAIEKQLPRNDTLLSFTGIQYERLTAGNTLEFILDFPSNPFLKKGYTWTTSTPTGATNFTINAVTGRTTTIVYSSTDLSGNLNSRTNGVLLIDNETGIILKRATQSVTTGYELVKGVVYTATRRTATSEVCFKKPGLPSNSLK
jgi:hypothetical protein